MDIQELDGKTLYLVTDKRRYGTMRSAGRTVSLEWAAEAKESGDVTKWASMMLEPELLPKLKRNEEGRSVNFFGPRIPDYYVYGQLAAHGRAKDCFDAPNSQECIRLNRRRRSALCQASPG